MPGTAPSPATPAVIEPLSKPPQSAVSKPAPTPAPGRPAPSAYATLLVNNIVSLDKSGVPRTVAEISAWKQGLKDLVGQREAAIPAIQEFLEKNVDLTFGSEDAQALGFASIRASLYDALVQIGGAGAVGVLLGTLQNSNDPHDLAALARSLDQAAPGQYGPQILDASRQALSVANSDKVNQTEVAALFQILTLYGGANAVADIQGVAGKYQYYSVIALGQLPDGAGIPALIDLVSNTGGGQVANVPALMALTQAAGENADARATLLALAQANNISAYGWANLTAILSGGQMQYVDSLSIRAMVKADNNEQKVFHIADGNQNFFTAPPAGGMSSEQMTRQAGLINQLLSVTTDTASVQALQTAQAALARHGAQISTVAR